MFFSGDVFQYITYPHVFFEQTLDGQRHKLPQVDNARTAVARMVALSVLQGIGQMRLARQPDCLAISFYCLAARGGGYDNPHALQAEIY